VSEGVVESTKTMFARHPWIFGGGLVALIVVLYVFSGSSKQKNPQNFTFSIGPTDAQLKNQTDLAIAQGNNQTAVSLAGIKSGIADDYFDYLTTSGKTAASAATSLAQISADTAKYKISMDDNTAVTIAKNNGQVAQNLATISGQSAVNLAGIQGTTAQNLALIGSNEATTLANIQRGSQYDLASVAALASDYAKWSDTQATMHGQDMQYMAVNLNNITAQQADARANQTQILLAQMRSAAGQKI
jgi:hypothetical protein